MNKKDAIGYLKSQRIITHLNWGDLCYVYLDDEGKLRDEDSDIIPGSLDETFLYHEGYKVVDILYSVEDATLLKREIKRQTTVINRLDEEILSLKRRLQDFENWNKHPY